MLLTSKTLSESRQKISVFRAASTAVFLVAPPPLLTVCRNPVTPILSLHSAAICSPVWSDEPSSTIITSSPCAKFPLKIDWTVSGSVLAALKAGTMNEIGSRFILTPPTKSVFFWVIWGAAHYEKVGGASSSMVSLSFAWSRVNWHVDLEI